MNSQIFRMGSSGGLEEIKPVPDLPLGLRVLSFGTGMMDTVWAICGERTDKGYPIVLMSKTFSENYDYIPFDILDEHTLPLSKKFGIGRYWDDSREPVIFTPRQIAVAVRRGNILQLYLKKKQAEETVMQERELKELPGKYPHLKPLKDKWDYNALRANIMADLKDEFPDVKFSIKKRHHESITVAWTDGPTETEVCTRVTNKWSDHETDFTGDYRDYAPSLFNKVFGGINYIFTSREFSVDINALSATLPERKGNYSGDAIRDTWRILSASSFPKGAFNFRIERNENVTMGFLEEYYKVAFDLPEKTQEAVPENITAEVISEGLQLIDYSEKCVVVVGDTRSVKDKLKAMGGLFNRKLTCGPGWVFPKKKTEDLEKMGCVRK